MKILVKYPSRERREQFLNVLHLMDEKASDKNNINYLVTLDSDDSTMANIEDDINVNNVTVIYGESDSKIHACNRDMEEIGGWDIVILVSDDMVPQIEGWDEVLRATMEKHFPDTDGALWFNDGYQPRTCTLTVFGKKYYDRFGWLYHPDYHSLFCDNEQTEVGLGLGKLQYFETVLFKHEHFANNSQVKRDSLYDRNEALFNIDKQTYEHRKAEGFPV
ncbi:hypothetical protein LCGC14_0388570 [marine sediment metagenome]|uniref:Glycosyltransferase 2-like domain-containing protein n=1 Tax=marine sediment metagenome TaxID=412755 RepID=A0A0F9T0B8_9ZZZZ